MSDPTCSCCISNLHAATVVTMEMAMAMALTTTATAMMTTFSYRLAIHTTPQHVKRRNENKSRADALQSVHIVLAVLLHPCSSAQSANPQAGPVVSFLFRSCHALDPSEFGVPCPYSACEGEGRTRRAFPSLSLPAFSVSTLCFAAQLLLLFLFEFFQNLAKVAWLSPCLRL